MSERVPPSMMSYVAARAAFVNGTDTPRDFLERCLERLDLQEPMLRAFAALAIPRARIAADAASRRWLAGTPLSPLDGMPIGVKDIIDTFDMPTGMGSPTSAPYRPLGDAASVFAAREAGAAIVGKTKTTEFATSFPTDTRNPHDFARTPGGSSSGSAAAVAAGILPVAFGTQVIGSILRPASFCGAFGFKPTFGAINRGGSLEKNLSHSCIGLIGASLEDLWVTAYEIVQRVGGDPGERGLVGSATPPSAHRPPRLVSLAPESWSPTPAASEEVEALLSRCSKAGVTIITRENDERVAALERSLADVLTLARDIVAYESLWPLKPILQRDPDGLSAGMREGVAKASALGIDGYRALLDRRAELRAAFAAVADDADAFVGLSAAGAAPKGLQTTGDPTFTAPAAVLGIPSVTLPILHDDGLPLGLQLCAGWHEDERLFAVAKWFMQLDD
ncbi:MAG TPA: amidase [Actinomycetes bacterium]|nr:amidase [Actinomycetes bacterium]